MISKGISEEDIEEFLNELKDIKLIDDKKFIENFLDLRIDTTGRLKLIQGLEKFGILEETARAYLSEYRERELKGLKRILESSLENCEDKKEIKKLLNRCLNKGYDWEDILSTMKELGRGRDMEEYLNFENGI